MKRTWMVAGLLALAAAGAQAVETRISITAGAPDFYGRIEIGNLPPPTLIYAEPRIVRPPAVVIEQAPIYLRVPPGHAKHWDKHCHRYKACNQRVYFVNEEWYGKVYAPSRHGEHEHEGKGHGKGHGKGKDKD